MPTTLDAIVAAKREGVARSRGDYDRQALEESASKHRPRGFRERLRRVAEHGIAVIAELKKASPSKGLIRPDFNPSELASDLEHAGAAALSVLTDEGFFLGSLDNLRQASASTSLPCLRKDFIVDELQIVEARANCADAVLLIVAALSPRELASLSSVARTQGLDVLCEVHDEEELQQALGAGCDLIGVNNRNLRTFEVNLDTALRLGEKIPANCVRVAESGIQSSLDLTRLRLAGYEGFLIGESLMKEERPGEALKKLLKEARVVAAK